MGCNVPVDTFTSQKSISSVDLSVGYYFFGFNVNSGGGNTINVSMSNTDSIDNVCAVDYPGFWASGSFNYSRCSSSGSKDYRYSQQY